VLPQLAHEFLDTVLDDIDITPCGDVGPALLGRLLQRLQLGRFGPFALLATKPSGSNGLRVAAEIFRVPRAARHDWLRSRAQAFSG